tara:strand:+ start:2608 stop:3501 length:894 start_codon:yes stop_codon:yes gene_type:complete
VFFQSCGKVAKVDKISMKWSSFDLDLPKGIEVYMGINKDIPLKAWVAKIDLSQENLSVRVLSSNDKDQRDTPLQFLQNNNARIIINGGYFNAEKKPIEHVGLLKTNGILEEPASHSVYRDSERYFISRGAFGVTHSGNVDIAWCSTKDDSIFEWERPLTNRPGYPNESLPFLSANYWDVRDALHAGPVLISNGEIDLNIEDEVFFNTPVAGVQPRSAIGYTNDQHLILMVVDGRQAESRGVYLEELALMMLEFKCLEALNLDGGGSSAMVADSRLLNRPSGRTAQREVMSAIGIFHK